MVYNVYCVNLCQALLESRFMRLQHVKLMLCMCEEPKWSLCVIHVWIFWIIVCESVDLATGKWNVLSLMGHPYDKGWRRLSVLFHLHRSTAACVHNINLFLEITWWDIYEELQPSKTHHGCFLLWSTGEILQAKEGALNHTHTHMHPFP